MTSSRGGRIVRAAARTRIGERALWSLASTDPQLLIEALGARLNRDPSFGALEEWPETVDGFDDLAFLFSSTQLNHGVVSLAIDEAAYLFRLVRSLGPGTIAEIGRYKGGSTMLIAAAMDPDATLWSYDVHVKLAETGADSDAEVELALARYGLEDRVHLLVADSKTAPPPADGCRLVFVDGDHAYASVRGDYENWRGAVLPGGHLLFHDAVSLRPFAVRDAEVARLMDEIRRDDGEQFREVGGAGGLLHFVRTDAAAAWTSS
jgi:predicted O-methyltransferase YrrM